MSKSRPDALLAKSMLQSTCSHLVVDEDTPESVQEEEQRGVDVLESGRQRATLLLRRERGFHRQNYTRRPTENIQ